MLSPSMNLLKNSLSCCENNGAQHTHISIVENDSSAALRKVTLSAPNGDWFSFNPDEGRKCKRIHQAAKNIVVMSPLLRIGGYDHHCACDCVVVVNRNGKLTVVYIDLKSGNPTGYSQQFKSSRQFLRYAIGLLEEFHQVKLEVEKEQYVIFWGGKKPLINKRGTVPKMNNNISSKPDSAYKREVFDSAKLYLKELMP